MDKNPINQVHERAEMNGMRKIMYLQKYGVKSFPYCGIRRHTPSISQSLDGGIVISNDVFGLTIRQFERKYKDCLDRRKTQEQWILNLRYPDKSSNAYLEYLQDCVYYNKDNWPWPGKDLKRKHVYDHLVYAVGTEIMIRNRQRLAIIIDMIANLFDRQITQISSGSLAEGLDLPGSDKDEMFLRNFVDVVQNLRNIKYPIQHDTLLMESDNNYPGFTRLRFIAHGETQYTNATLKCFESTKNGLYLKVDECLDTQSLGDLPACVHGPAISGIDQSADFVTCLRSKSLPYSAIPWLSRHRHQWPPNFVIDQIKKYGCLLVPIGPKTILDSRLLWRLSFSVAEKQLVHSFNYTQLLCYGLLKLTLRRIISTNVDVKDLLCSYFLKTALFWVSEEVDIETFQLVRLFHCFCLCLDKLMIWINNCYCPNYFIHKHNMFLGKVDQSNNKTLLSVLDSIKCGGIDGLINNLFPTENVNACFLSSNSESSFIMLDFYFYRIGEKFIVSPSTNFSVLYKILQFTESLQMFESSKFIIDSCEYYYGKISQYAVQFLPPPTTINKINNILKLYHKYLKDGTKTDAVSGWLLYTSFYYVTGHYNVTLKLIEYVELTFTHDLMSLNNDTYQVGHMNSYKQ